MGDLAYVSEVRLERRRGPVRVAILPGEPRPVVFSVHGAIAEHYGRKPSEIGEPHAATLDYVVAAAGGWLLGTFGSALEARKIDASDGKLTGEVRGEIESEAGVLVIKRIHVHMTLRSDEAARPAAERVHAHYKVSCPVYRSLSGCIAITSSFDLEPSPAR